MSDSVVVYGLILSNPPHMQPQKSAPVFWRTGTGTSQLISITQIAVLSAQPRTHLQIRHFIVVFYLTFFTHFLSLIFSLTLILLTWTIWRAPTNARKWRMGFNSAFKGLNNTLTSLGRAMSQGDSQRSLSTKDWFILRPVLVATWSIKGSGIDLFRIFRLCPVNTIVSVLQYGSFTSLPRRII
jgi:hypothetical protein